MLDVRLKRIGRGDELNGYALPSSAFLLAAHGQGELRMDDEVWLSERYRLLHAGKGRRITVRADGPLDVYLILYKTALPASALREFHMMLQTSDPFEQSWAIVPAEPLELLELIDSMLGAWARGDDGLRRLQVRGDFIRFVHAVLSQRERADGADSPSLAEQVVRHLARHYRRTISLDRLARQLNYSPQYVSRKFKEQTGRSPMDYVIGLRMDRARELLQTSEASLQEISAHVGYADLMYFNRLFKKTVGLTPGQYRKQFARTIVSKNTMNWTNPSVVLPLPARYDVNGNDIHSQYLQDGAYRMTNHTRKLSAVVLLGLTMILSACGAGANGTAGSEAAGGEKPAGSAANAASPEASASGSAETEPATRTVSTAFGEVEVPRHPQRVAAISYLGTVLALGTQPVAGETFLMSSPYLKGMLDDIEDVGDSLEKLLATEPDLIITHNPNQEAIDQYKRIAPTVSVPYNAFASIQEEMRYFGEILDRQQEAEQWIEEFEKRIKELRDQVQTALKPGQTVSIMQEYDGTVFLFGSKSGRGGRIMYEMFETKPPAAIPAHMLEESYYEFSLENLSEYMGDYLVLTTERSLEQLQADPIWGKLPPIRDNRVLLWTENESWYRDPIAVYGQIEKLANWLVETAGK
ncbi:AraC family transcriptional regulator [Cohnella cellulosilytica]|uniref:AraC family transcriptional regulator n=1 Tax=Cohnella cellulosilytica TaxID=986710 RepID=UPI0035E86615